MERTNAAAARRELSESDGDLGHNNDSLSSSSSDLVRRANPSVHERGNDGGPERGASNVSVKADNRFVSNVKILLPLES
jgi:hypothetical protein